MKVRPGRQRLLLHATLTLIAIGIAMATVTSQAAAAVGRDTVADARSFTCATAADDGSIDPAAVTVDTYGDAELQSMADKQARFSTWLDQSQPRALRSVPQAPLSRYVRTRLHLQQTGYWCGPASVEIIDDKWGRVVSGSTETARQRAYADYMGTTTAGTNFTVVDNALNHYITESGIVYVYQSNLRTRAAVYDWVRYDVGVSHYPLAADLRIDANTDSNWRPYRLYHDGHIVPIDGYNYNSGYYKIRINDPNNESRWHPGAGGATSGHHSYPRATFADGVLTSLRPDLIW